MFGYSVTKQRLISSKNRQVNRKTYSQCGAAAHVAFTSQPLVFLVRGAVGHEGPLDHSLRGLCEGKGPRHLSTQSRKQANKTFHSLFGASLNAKTHLDCSFYPSC